MVETENGILNKNENEEEPEPVADDCTSGPVRYQSQEVYIPTVLSLFYADITAADLKNLITVYAAFSCISREALSRKGRKKKMLVSDDILARGSATRTLPYSVFGIDHHHHEQFDQNIMRLSGCIYLFPDVSMNSGKWRRVKPFNCRLVPGGVEVSVASCVFQLFFIHASGIEKIDLNLVRQMTSRYTIRTYLLLQSWRKSYFAINYISLHRMYCTDDQLHDYKSFIADLRRARRELKAYYDEREMSYYFDYKSSDFAFQDNGICRPEKVTFMKYWQAERLTPSRCRRYNRRVKVVGSKIESTFHIPSSVVFDWVQKIEPNTITPVEELVDCCVRKLKTGQIFPMSNYLRRGLERIFSHSDGDENPNTSGTPHSGHS